MGILLSHFVLGSDVAVHLVAQDYQLNPRRTVYKVVHGFLFDDVRTPFLQYFIVHWLLILIDVNYSNYSIYWH